MSMRQWLRLSPWLAGTIIVLLWPAFFNHQPFYFPDTRTYIRVADTAIQKLAHRTTEWSRLDEKGATAAAPQAAPGVDEAPLPPPTPASSPARKPRGPSLMYGRSIYYGTLLYLGMLSGGFWLTVVLQAVAVVAAVYLLLRALQWPVWPALPAIAISLAILSDISFFSSFLMPDLFAGLVVLCCALLLSVKRTFDPATYLLFYLLMAVGMVFHDSCGLISLCLVGLAVIVNLLSRNWKNGRGLAIIVLAVFTGIVGQQLFGIAVQKAMGEKPMRYPFLSARLIDDGPGADYLRATCPASGFLLCKYGGEFPINSEDFLFGAQPGHTVFATASHDERLALSKEQFRFLIAVFRYEPVATIQSGVDNAARQFVDFGINDFSYAPKEKDYFNHTLPISRLPAFHASAAYNGKVPAKTLTFLYGGIAVISILYLALLWLRVLPAAPPLDPTLKVLCGWIFAGLIVNAIVCGSLSGVFPRYQARVLWLVPLLAISAAFQAFMQRSSRQHAHLHETDGVAARPDGVAAGFSPR